MPAHFFLHYFSSVVHSKYHMVNTGLHVIDRQKKRRYPSIPNTSQIPTNIVKEVKDVMNHLIPDLKSVQQNQRYELTWTRASTWCITMGIFANGTRGLGNDSVSGLNRVPNPPTRINAFMVACSVPKINGNNGNYPLGCLECSSWSSPD